MTVMATQTLAQRIQALFEYCWPTTQHHLRFEPLSDDRIVVQVMSQDRERTFATINFLPDLSWNGTVPTVQGYTPETSFPGQNAGMDELSETVLVLNATLTTLTQMAKSDLIRKGV